MMTGKKENERNKQTMARTFYAVQVGNNYDCDDGSTVKRTAYQMARRYHKEYPGEEIRIAICTTESDDVGEVITVFEENLAEKIAAMKDLSGEDFSCKDLRGIDFSGKDLTGKRSARSEFLRCEVKKSKFL